MDISGGHDPVIGIDFGAVTSSVGVVNKGQVLILPVEDDGGQTLLNIVAFDESKILLGQAAQNYHNEKKKVFFPYQEDGTPTVPVDGKLKYRIDQNYYSHEEVIAQILGRLKETAEKHLDEKVWRTVITVQPDMNQSQRDSVNTAATLAGLKIVEEVNAPCAVVAAYENSLDIKELEEGDQVLVVRGDGYTLDVAVLSLSDGRRLMVLASEQNKTLGGEDLDDMLTEHCAKVFNEENRLELRRQDEEPWESLRTECEAMKKELIHKSSYCFRITNLYQGKDLQLDVTRENFEEMALDFFQQAVNSVEGLLSRNELERQRIRKVYLAGDTCKIPKMRSLMEGAFGKDKVVTDERIMDYAVTYGATVLTIPWSQPSSSVVAVASKDLLRILEISGSAISETGEEYWLVFDCGRESLDLTQFTQRNKELEILAYRKDTELGGNAIDYLLAEHFMEKFNTVKMTNVRKDMDEQWRHLLDQGEKAKIELSTTNFYRVAVKSFYNRIDFNMLFVKRIFDILTEKIFEKSVNAVHELLETCSPTKKNSIKILLVGGNVRIPKIRDLLEQAFGKKRIHEVQLKKDKGVVRNLTRQAQLGLKELEKRQLEQRRLKEAENKRLAEEKLREAENKRLEQEILREDEKNHLEHDLPVVVERYTESEEELESSISEPVILHNQDTKSDESKAQQDMLQTEVDPERSSSQHHKDSSPVIGVDLGTTSSAVGIIQNSQVHVLSVEEDAAVFLPSYVAFKIPENGADQLELLYGNHAKDHEIEEDVAFCSKRLLGREFTDPYAQEVISCCSFNMVNDKNRPKYDFQHNKDNITYFPEEISAFILERLKKLAEDHLNQTIYRAVIAVPASFNQNQRQATKAAAKLAGLEVMNFLSEPCAAAVAHAMDIKFQEKEQVVLVFDFGGGTLDVAILSVSKKLFKVLAIGGDTHLGGEDIDNLLADHFRREFNRENKVVLEKSNTKAWRRLRRQSERIKITLSRSYVSNFRVESLFKGKDIHSAFTRVKFEELCRPLFERAMNLVQEVLQSSKINKESIEKVLLVGGTAKIPKIQKLLEEHFGQEKIIKDVHFMDQAVVRGATVMVTQNSQNFETLYKNIPLQDVLPLSIGYRRANGMMVRVLERNTPIPAEITKVFATRKKNQTVLRIIILEGESEKAKENFEIGELCMGGIVPAQAGTARLRVTFRVGVDGELATTTDKSTSQQFNRTGMTAQEIQKVLDMKRSNTYLATTRQH